MNPALLTIGAVAALAGAAAVSRRRGSRSTLLESFGVPEGATRTSSTPGFFGYRWGPVEWDLIDMGD